jgi:hypothetical protein
MRVSTITVPMSLRVLDDIITKDNIKNVIKSYKQFRKIVEEDIVEENITKIEEPEQSLGVDSNNINLAIETQPIVEDTLFVQNNIIEEPKPVVETKSLEPYIEPVTYPTKFEGASKSKKYIIPILLSFIIMLLIVIIALIKIPPKVVIDKQYVVKTSKPIKVDEFKPQLTNHDEMFGNVEV